MSRIPEYTPELGRCFQENTDTLIAMGVKEWMKSKRKSKYKMTEIEQEEELKRIEQKVEEESGKGA